MIGLYSDKTVKHDQLQKLILLLHFLNNKTTLYSIAQLKEQQWHFNAEVTPHFVYVKKTRFDHDQSEEKEVLGTCQHLPGRWRHYAAEFPVPLPFHPASGLIAAYTDSIPHPSCTWENTHKQRSNISHSIKIVIWKVDMNIRKQWKCSQILYKITID